MIIRLFLPAILLTFFFMPASIPASEIRQIYIEDEEDKIKPGHSVKGSKDAIKKQNTWVVVEGRAGLSSGISIARRAALISAYRHAIDTEHHEAGTEFSQSDNLQSIVDILANKRNSYIKQYMLLGGGIDMRNKQSYAIKMKAFIVDKFENEQEQDDNLSDFIRLIGTPRVLLLLAENHDENAAAYSSKVTEKLIANHLKKVGYVVLTTKSIKNQISPEEMDKARMGNSLSASNIGLKMSADLVITGKFNFETTVGMTKDPLCCNLFTFNFKAVLPGSKKEVYFITEQKYKSSGGNEKREFIRGLVRITDFVSDNLKTKSLSILSKSTSDIAVTVRNSTSLNAGNIKNHLATLEGVSEVEMSEWNESQTLYKVKSIYTGPRGQVLSEVLEHTFPGLTATSINKNNIEMIY